MNSWFTLNTLIKSIVASKALKRTICTNLFSCNIIETIRAVAAWRIIISESIISPTGDTVRRCSSAIKTIHITDCAHI